MSSFLLEDPWNFPGSKTILRTTSNGSGHDAGDLQTMEDLKQRAQGLQSSEGPTAPEFLFDAEQEAHCTVNAAQAYKLSSTLSGHAYNITADTFEQPQTGPAAVLPMEPQTNLESDLGTFDACQHKMLLAVLGVSVADDIDSTKSANSDFRESPNTPSQLNSFPHTPCSSSLLSEQNPLQQPQQQRSAHRRLFSGVNPLLGTFPDANLPPLLAPSERSLSSFPSVPPSSFLSLGSLGQSRANGHHRTNSMPLPLDEHLWGAPQASKGTQRLPAYLSQQAASSSYPMLGSLATIPAAAARTPPRLHARRVRSPQPDSSLSSEHERISGERRPASGTPEISATDTDDSISGDAPRKRRKGSKRMSCRQCGTHNTPQWRMGPEGPRTLCNACGVRYTKLRKAGPDAGGQ